jgi:outer membrane protein OmpA-like peptidoglycan-associated protein
MRRLCVCFLILPLLIGCSPFRKHHFRPEDTVTADLGDDIFFAQSSLEEVAPDLFQLAYNYSKSDIVASVFFDFDKSNVGEEYASKLTATVKFFLQNPDRGVLVVGHCDHFGTPKYNNLLGLRRAENVKNRLVELGLDESRITVASAGSDQASKFCSNVAMTLIDRRADVVLSRSLSGANISELSEK